MVETWTRSCPVTGRCSECGLEIRWALVLDPELAQAPQYVESRRGLRLKDVRTTALRALLPWRFWRWVPIEQPIIVPRLARGVVLASGAWHVLVVVVVIAGNVAAAGLARMTYGFVDWYGNALAALWPGHSVRYMHTSELWGYFALLASLPALVPCLYLLVPTTLARARIRLVHLARIGVGSYFGYPLVVGAYLALESARWFADELHAWETELALRQASIFVPIGLVVVWNALWWGCAGSRYLRIRRPWTFALGRAGTPLRASVTGTALVLVRLTIP